MKKQTDFDFPWSVQEDENGLRVIAKNGWTIYERDWTDWPGPSPQERLQRQWYIEECGRVAAYIVGACNASSPENIWTRASEEERKVALDAMALSPDLADFDWGCLSYELRGKMTAEFARQIMAFGGLDTDNHI